MKRKQNPIHPARRNFLRGAGATIAATSAFPFLNGCASDGTSPSISSGATPQTSKDVLGELYSSDAPRPIAPTSPPDGVTENINVYRGGQALAEDFQRALDDINPLRAQPFHGKVDVFVQHLADMAQGELSCHPWIIMRSEVVYENKTPVIHELIRATLRAKRDPVFRGLGPFLHSVLRPNDPALPHDGVDPFRVITGFDEPSASLYTQSRHQYAVDASVVGFMFKTFGPEKTLDYIHMSDLRPGGIFQTYSKIEPIIFGTDVKSQADLFKRWKSDFRDQPGSVRGSVRDLTLPRYVLQRDPQVLDRWKHLDITVKHENILSKSGEREIRDDIVYAWDFVARSLGYPQNLQRGRIVLDVSSDQYERGARPINIFDGGIEFRIPCRVALTGQSDFVPFFSGYAIGGIMPGPRSNPIFENVVGRLYMSDAYRAETASQGRKLRNAMFYGVDVHRIAQSYINDFPQPIRELNLGVVPERNSAGGILSIDERVPFALAASFGKFLANERVQFSKYDEHRKYPLTSFIDVRKGMSPLDAWGADYGTLNGAWRERLRRTA